MIAAEFVPACPSAWHRAVLELVLAGRWSDIPLASWPPLVWFATPAAVVTALALVAVMLKRPRVLVLVLGLSAFVNLWLPLALAPLLLATRPWPPMEQWRTTLTVAAALLLGAFVATPSCDRVVDGFALAPPARMPAMVFATIGIAGVALLAADAAFSRGSRHTQAVCLAVAAMTATIATMAGGADGTALLGLLVALTWSRVAAGGRHLLQWQTTRGGRVGAVLLLMLVPLLAVAKAARPGPRDAGPRTREVWSALDAPAAVVATGGRADVAAQIWRAGPLPAQHALVLLPLVPEVVGTQFDSRAIHAWGDPGEALATQGFVVAPGVASKDNTAPLSRLVDYTACRALSSEWTDVQGIATDGQFTAVMPEVAPLRGGLIYLAATARLTPQPINWPPEGLGGFQVAAFDRQVPAETAALTESFARDQLDSQRLGDARFVYRVRFDRLATSSAALRIGLGGRAETAWGRLYTRDDPRPSRRPSLCLSRAGFAVTGYPGAPAQVDLNLSAPQVVGSGWHAFERVGQDGFRWTAAREADIFFVVHQPQPMALHLDASPGTGDWASARMRVTLNGADAQCGAATMPCDWALPVEAMRRGLNVITLHATPVQAPAPDQRQLGLLVHGASLSTAPRTP
jgi:hypothetical protein